MPTYDYRCRDCGHTIELIHGMTEDGPSACEVCGGPVRRVLFPTGIIFKGSGFYRNDSRSGATSAGPTPAAGGSPTATKPASTDGSTPPGSAPSTGADAAASPPTTPSTGADG